jgi:hypothetical protein
VSTAGEHVVSLMPQPKSTEPDVFALRCSCGWRATVTGVESARAAAVAHADRRKTGGERP